MVAPAGAYNTHASKGFNYSAIVSLDDRRWLATRLLFQRFTEIVDEVLLLVVVFVLFVIQLSLLEREIKLCVLSSKLLRDSHSP